MALLALIANIILLLSLHFTGTVSLSVSKQQHVARSAFSSMHQRSGATYYGASSRTTFMQLASQGKDTEEELQTETKDINPVAKASWFAVEAFGNVFGKKKETMADDDGDDASLSYSLSDPPQSIKETLQRIQDDNDRSYFLSGEVDKLIYDEKCIFADPFVSFEGRDRFVDNLANLGSFITKYSARMLNYEVQDESTVKTKVMVKLELNLPWKPVLAWPWGVLYKIDTDTNLIVVHEESWDIEPLEGVKQIFRPATLKIED